MKWRIVKAYGGQFNVQRKGSVFGIPVWFNHFCGYSDLPRDFATMDEAKAAIHKCEADRAGVGDVVTEFEL